MILRISLFLLANFAALGIGGLFTGSGVSSSWYAELNKAPWTPPGWMFGAAWSTIMICFAVYMAYLWPKTENKPFLIGLFVIQWILNVLWNPVFFYFQNVGLGMLVILALTLLVGFFLLKFYPVLKVKTILIVPYFLWLIIASSLNLYILTKN